MNVMNRWLILFCLAASGVCSPLQAAEGLKLPQTRVIFNAGDKSATAGIQNLSRIPYLVKAEVRNIYEQTGQLPVPFGVVPPLFRLEPQSQYTVRILPLSDMNLPSDRESVFYLSFLAIPSTVKPGEPGGGAAVSARVSVGLQTLIKLFYRPAALPMSVREAEGKLVFHTGLDMVVMENPTPYYLTLNTLTLKGQDIDLTKSGAMIAPFSEKTYHILGKSNTAAYTVINDYGAMSRSYTREISSLKVKP